MEKHFIGWDGKEMKLTKIPLLRQTFNKLPSNWKSDLIYFYRRGEHWAHPDLKRYGTVQDLYYWVVDQQLDTVLPLQNYFSVFFPEIDTTTIGRISIFDNQGERLGEKLFSLPHCGGAHQLI